jgi:hypothetical protein
LVGRPQEFHPTVTKTAICLRHQPCCRHNSSVAAAIQEKAASNSEDAQDSGSELSSLIPRKAIDPLPLGHNNRNGSTNHKRRYSDLDYGPWKESLWTRDEIEFESNLDEKGTKLLDQPAHRRDLRLWACLFDYRQRVHGASGVAMFWDAVKRGDFKLPMTGAHAQQFWEKFVDLGLQNIDILNEVRVYADQMLKSTNKRWLSLYIKIVQHMLLTGRGKEALVWHNRLFLLHPPGPRGFGEMVRQVIFQQGDMEALKQIYQWNNHHNVYGKVVPFLCEKEDFKMALEWHFTFINEGDLPATSKKAEALLHFLAIHDHPRAIQVTRSLVDAGVPFTSSISSTLKENTIISREMMNRMHGETFNMPAKTYNDNLGARWFATRWVSLNVAMLAISALGVKEIGPLSLQAIALRERDAESITERINQLRDLDVSIDKSKFSSAVEQFARARNQAYLDGLLNSDQHPDAFEDSKLQEQLLNTYARSQDWFRYRLTLAVLVIGSKHPEMETTNIILRTHVETRDTSALLLSLQKMHVDGAIVTAHTVRTILRGLLRPRLPGRRPIPTPIKYADDLKLAIGILKGIMESGSFVSASHWREIIKRLGMAGRWRELQDLCVFLASWYGPANANIPLGTIGRERFHRYRVPAQVKASHPLHHLRILFPVTLLRAIVEWGFIHALRAPNNAIASQGIIKDKPSPLVTSGIDLLKRLAEYGVHINMNSVNRAIFNRLVIYYGPGRSSKRYNRRARENNVLSLEEMAAQIDEALGKRSFNYPNLGQVIEAHGISRLERRAQRLTGHAKTRTRAVLGLSN